MFNEQSSSSTILPQIKRSASLSSDTTSDYYETSLNAWYRQLGNPSKQSKVKKSKNGSQKLPVISEYSSSNSLAATSDYTFSRTKKKKTLPSLGSFNRQADFKTITSIEAELKSLESDVEKNTSSFMQRCIEEVESSNKPDKIKLGEPRELKYVQELANMRYTSVGFGRSLGYIWHIEIFKV